MRISINRKCKHCKEIVEIISEEAICEKNTYYHLNCFIQKKLNNKRNKLSKEEIMSLVKQLQEDNKEKVKLIIEKETLYKWIQDNYNIMVLPSYFFVKMESIYDGSFKGLRCGIPPKHILDMWKTKRNFLNKTYESNIRKGKSMDKIGRVNYDLAILINKYDSYLNWLNKQKVIECEKEQPKLSNNLYEFKSINRIVDNNQSSENDISSLLDEVF